MQSPFASDYDFGSVTLPADLIERHLDKVLASNLFDASERNRRFLRYIVEETIAGRGDRLKGYTVAIAVFDRDADFDPQFDPVVRIEAGRLRRSLERYYLTEGSTSEIIISIPKGKYIAQFESRSSRLAERLETISFIDRYHTSILVSPFSSLSAAKSADAVGFALTDELVLRISEVCPATVYINRAPAPPSERDVVIGQDVDREACQLHGSIQLCSKYLRVIAYISDWETGRLMWSRSEDSSLESTEISTALKEVATRLADGILYAMTVPDGLGRNRLMSTPKHLP